MRVSCGPSALHDLAMTAASVILMLAIASGANGTYPTRAEAAFGALPDARFGRLSAASAGFAAPSPWAGSSGM
jgi:hypothetical protein